MSLFGQTVRDRRQAQGLSQDDLAERVGISRNYLSQIERGLSTNVSWPITKKICDALGLPAPGTEPPPSDVPDALRRLAEEESLGPKDVADLAAIEYRGKRPESVEEWRLLYLALKTATARR
jgi:transcriptional regulator with XRE-family HTH domain